MKANYFDFCNLLFINKKKVIKDFLFLEEDNFRTNNFPFYTNSIYFFPLEYSLEELYCLSKPPLVTKAHLLFLC